MPPTASTLRVGRYFLSLLLILVVLYGLVFLPGRSRTPKLGIDLVGGAQITFTAKTSAGKTPSESSMKVARQILDKRVNGSGVSAAQVYQQGADQIVIAVPGASSDAKAKLAQVGKAAQLNLRPLVMAAVAPPTAATPTDSTSPGATPTGSTAAGATSSATAATTAATTAAASTAAASSAAAGSAAAGSGQGISGPLGFAPSDSTVPTGSTVPTTPTTTPTGTTSPAAATTTAPSAADLLSTASLGFAVPTTEAAYEALTADQKTTLQGKVSGFSCSTTASDDPKQVLLSCDSSGLRYLLGPVVVKGTQITDAAAVAPNLSGTGGNAQWTVSIDMSDSGQTAWAEWTAAHNTSGLSSSVTATASASACSTATVPCEDIVAFTLDQTVISAPSTNSTINGSTSVSGSFTEKTANDLADQLRFGALPLSFDPSEAQDISATLGTSQLRAGLLAGGIGLALVVLYSLFYYRGLGLVTVSSLLVSGALTYASLVILGHEMGFTLTLSGIAGFIVAIGITADSFVVFFERLKDEVHEGRSIRVAVPRAWARSRRTILSADTVSFLAAAVLYYFSASDVRGFAFTLGLSTLLDLVVVFLFTHPIVSLLARSRTFGSPRFTGLNSVRRTTTPLLADDDRAARAPRPARAATPSRSRSSSVALLEPETELDEVDELNEVDELDDFDEIDEVDEVVAAPPAPTTPAEPVSPVRSPKRSRVVPRSVPTEIGASAAERAAARRGRAVRPKPEEPDDVDTDELEPVDELDSVDDVDDVDDVADVVAAEAVEADVDVDEPIPAVAETAAKPVKAERAEVIAEPAESAPTNAAERAAARRRRTRADVAPPPATVETQAVVSEAVEQVTAAQPRVESPVVESAPAAALSPAAARAAARRARIKANAAEQEDEA